MDKSNKNRRNGMGRMGEFVFGKSCVFTTCKERIFGTQFEGAVQDKTRLRAKQKWLEDGVISEIDEQNNNNKEPEKK